MLFGGGGMGSGDSPLKHGNQPNPSFYYHVGHKTKLEVKRVSNERRKGPTWSSLWG